MSSPRWYRAFFKLYARALITAAYAGILKRAPDVQGLAAHAGALARHGNLARAAGALEPLVQLDRIVDEAVALYRQRLGDATQRAPAALLASP